MAVLHADEFSRVFGKKIFRALGFSSCCCCSDLEMLTAEICRIYSDAGFALALWARVEFRSAVSIHGFESGIDTYHTYKYNSIPKPSPSCLLCACSVEGFPSAAKWRFCRESKGTIMQQKHRQQELSEPSQSQYQHVQLCSAASKYHVLGFFGLLQSPMLPPVPGAKSKASPHTIPTRGEPHSHVRVKPSHPLPPNATNQSLR